jgi:hypothetical protein
MRGTHFLKRHPSLPQRRSAKKKRSAAASRAAATRPTTATNTLLNQVAAARREMSAAYQAFEQKYSDNPGIGVQLNAELVGNCRLDYGHIINYLRKVTAHNAVRTDLENMLQNIHQLTGILNQLSAAIDEGLARQIQYVAHTDKEEQSTEGESDISSSDSESNSSDEEERKPATAASLFGTDEGPVDPMFAKFDKAPAAATDIAPVSDERDETAATAATATTTTKQVRFEEPVAEKTVAEGPVAAASKPRAAAAAAVTGRRRPSTTDNPRRRHEATLAREAQAKVSARRTSATAPSTRDTRKTRPAAEAAPAAVPPAATAIPVTVTALSPVTLPSTPSSTEHARSKVADDATPAKPAPAVVASAAQIETALRAAPALAIPGPAAALIPPTQKEAPIRAEVITAASQALTDYCEFIERMQQEIEDNLGVTGASASGQSADFVHATNLFKHINRKLADVLELDVFKQTKGSLTPKMCTPNNFDAITAQLNGLQDRAERLNQVVTEISARGYLKDNTDAGHLHRFGALANVLVRFLAIFSKRWKLIKEKMDMVSGFKKDLDVKNRALDNKFGALEAAKPAEWGLFAPRSGPQARGGQQRCMPLQPQFVARRPVAS